MRCEQLAPCLLLLVAVGCAIGIRLTERGEQVHRMEAAAPGCRILGDVPIGIPPDAARPRTEEQLVILMRNKAAQMGGTHLVVESSEHREGTEGEEYYYGRGISYICPEGAERERVPRPVATPAAPPDAGVAPTEEEDRPGRRRRRRAHGNP